MKDNFFKELNLDIYDEDTGYKNPKSLLDRNLPINKGSFVTIDDDMPLRAYVVTRMSEQPICWIARLMLTEIGDDLYIEEKCINISKLICLDDSFISIGSPLWRFREKIIDML